MLTISVCADPAASSTGCQGELCCIIIDCMADLPCTDLCDSWELCAFRLSAALMLPAEALFPAYRPRQGCRHPPDRALVGSWSTASAGCSMPAGVHATLILPQGLTNLRRSLYRLLANLYSGNVYIWNYNDQASSTGLRCLEAQSSHCWQRITHAALVLTCSCHAADGGQVLRGHRITR